jgi:hypothetical protein
MQPWLGAAFHAGINILTAFLTFGNSKYGILTYSNKNSPQGLLSFCIGELSVCTVLRSE